MKFNYGKIFLLGFGYFGTSVIWSVYNAFVPVFLANKFGLSAGLIGFFMTLDNIAALFIQPPVGAWSDRLRTPIGRRMPFILVGAPISAVAFGLIPIAAALPLFVACTSTLLLSMALWRTPVIALMPDVTPSPLRSQANGIINFMGGIGAIIAFLVGSSLYRSNPAFPFWMGSGLVIVAAILVLILVKEPKIYERGEADRSSDLPGFTEFIRKHSMLLVIGFAVFMIVTLAISFSFPSTTKIGDATISNSLIIPVVDISLWVVGLYAYYMAREPIHDKDKSAFRLFLAIFCWFIGFNAIEAFFTLYSVNQLGLNEADGASLLGHLSLFFVLFALVSGFIGGKFGRRVTISAGLTGLAALIGVMFVLPADTLATPLANLPLLGTVRVVSLFLMGIGIA